MNNAGLTGCPQFMEGFQPGMQVKLRAICIVIAATGKLIAGSKADPFRGDSFEILLYGDPMTFMPQCSVKTDAGMLLDVNGTLSLHAPRPMPRTV